MYYTKRRSIYIIILAIVLFSIGRFYIEVQSFFNTPYSVIGLLFVSQALLIYYIQYQKMRIERISRARDEYSHMNEEYRMEIRNLKNKKK